MLEESAVATGMRAPPRLRVGAAVAIALPAGFVTWLVLRPGPDSQAVSQVAPASAVPRLVPAAQLRAHAAALGHPLYWAGRRPGLRYELTEAGGGRTYIRYLPLNVAAGDRRPQFLAIGTYARQDAFSETEAAGRRPGVVTARLSGTTTSPRTRSGPSRPGARL